MKRPIQSVLLVGFIGSIIWLSCKKEPKWNLEKTIPFVKTGQVTEIKGNSVFASGEVVHNAGLDVLKLGFCLAKHQDSLSIDNATVIEMNSSVQKSKKPGSINKSYSVDVEDFIGHYKGAILNLKENTTYYLRAFASNEVGTGYGDIINFTTLKLSQVSTDSVASIGTNSAICYGKVLNDWGYAVNERGICYGIDSLPDIEKHSKLISGMGLGAFNCQLTLLSTQKKYFYRAYAINQAGVAYGKCKSFATLNIGTPKVITNSPYNISTNSASCSGNITDDGGSFVTARGICYSTTINPTTSNSIISSGTGTGTFNTNMSGLLAGKTYYVRAYAINAYGTAYGNEVSFTTIATIPSITTSAITNLTDVSCTSGGTIVQDGGYAISQKGVCWSTTINPTISNSKTNDGSGTSSFISNVSGLNASTTYYLRAYATNSLGTGYGSQISFTTAVTQTIPTVVTSSTITAGNYYANTTSNVTSDGNATVTARGVCWSTSATPTLSNSFSSDGTGTGSYSSALINLIGSTKYYYRAYATNAKGTAYGSIYSFTTSAAGLASLTTTSVSNITSSQANSGGTINNNGGSLITAKGVCWSTSANPTISNSKTSDGTGNTSYTSILSSLSSNTNYYIRAYATNGVGTAYGNQISFTTGATIPAVSTKVVSSSDQTSFTAGGNATSDGGSTITAKGICWSTSTAPTISNSKTNDGTGTGSFISLASGLNPNTTYYYRAYATNSIGTSYGIESSITTNSLTIPSISTIAPNSISYNSASSGGNTISDGGSSITAKGVCWNTTGTPTIANSKTTDGTGTANFTSNLTGLSTGVTYYVRAYATNAIGTAYGSSYLFTPNLGTPTLNSPINNALISSYFYLNWSCVPGATSYDLQISTSSIFSGTTYSLPISPGGWLRTAGVMSGTQSATCSSGSVTSDMMQTTTTSGAGTYYFYWRVRARTSTVIGSWSSLGTFKFIK
jgi:hypothetical protein